MDEIGCEACWSSESATAWDKVKHVPIETRLIDESHFIVSIRKCTACSQRYLQITTETIDWEDGEDPIHRIVMPIDEQDRDRLQPAQPLGSRTLEGVGVGRRCLRYDWPKGQSPRASWGIGIQVGPHG